MRNEFLMYTTLLRNGRRVLATMNSGRLSAATYTNYAQAEKRVATLRESVAGRLAHVVRGLSGNVLYIGVPDETTGQEFFANPNAKVKS